MEDGAIGQWWLVMLFFSFIFLCFLGDVILGFSID
jgi:hypothetical protein